MLGVALAASLIPAVARAGHAATRIIGAGKAEVTDPDGVQSPLAFAIAGRISAGGSAGGGASFLFEKPFAADWGAVPGVVDLIWLNVEFTTGSIAEDGSIVFGGEWVEVDYSFDEGVVFVEKDTELTTIFELVIAPDGKTMLIHWCELPQFGLEVTNGKIRIR
jgi:hypothetical protein